LLEAATRKRDWEHYSVCDSNLWSAVKSSVQQIQSSIKNSPIVTRLRDNAKMHLKCNMSVQIGPI
jgi:hypothetical protein